MSSELNLLKINKFVLHKQRLAGEKADESLVETVRAVGGLHATNAATPYLSLFARRANFRREQLDAELYVKRNLVFQRIQKLQRMLRGSRRHGAAAMQQNLQNWRRSTILQDSEVLPKEIA